MRVFISWSREPSRTIAVALAEWLGGLVQAVEPWVSDAEIGSGKRWRDEVATVLDKTDFGIICLTRDNQHNPWLMFESGALAKRLELARVVPLYIDLDAAEVTGPLADWQGRSLDRDGMQRIVHDINAATPKPVAKEALQKLFDRMWPDLEAEVTAAKSGITQPAAARRSAEDMLEELVERVRRLDRPTGYSGAPVLNEVGAVAALQRLIGRQHGDLHSRNVLISPENVGKIIDIAYARDLLSSTWNSTGEERGEAVEPPEDPYPPTDGDHSS